MRPTRRVVALAVAAMLVGSACAWASDASPRYIIYVHGRIVQEEQSARPRHAEFGYYELEEILDAFRERGFVVSSAIRPRSATVESAADSVAAQVRRLLAAGVRADRITIVGGSMGGGIALLASARLQNPDLRFCVLGVCLADNVRALAANGDAGPSGRVLAIRESSDDLTEPCAAWTSDAARASTPSLDAREIVLHTGLRHGFLYRPLSEWLEPVVAWATADRDTIAPSRERAAGRAER